MSNPLTQRLIAGAIAGLSAAAAVDIHAWQNDGFKFSFAKTFDWSLAFQRWTGGAIVGALAVLKIGSVN